MATATVLPSNYQAPQSVRPLANAVRNRRDALLMQVAEALDLLEARANRLETQLRSTTVVIDVNPAVSSLVRINY